MGYFSKCCAKTNLPVLCAESYWGEFAPRLCRVVMLAPNGDRITRDYGGYGCDELDFEDCKMVLADAYRNESFEQLGKSFHEPGQGVFHSRGLIAVLKEMPSLPSHKAYCDLYRDHGYKETDITLQLLTERGVHCDGALVFEVGRALEHLADDHDFEYEQMLLQKPEIAKWVPAGFDDAKRFAKLYDEALLSRTMACAQNLVAALKA